MRFASRVATVGLAAAAIATIGVIALFAGAPENEAGIRPTPATSAGSADPTPAGSGFVASPRDVDGPVKEAAARFVERVGTWQPPGPTNAADRVTDAGYPPDLATTAAPLVDIPAREAATTIIYPQYGGLTETAASVMVLARQQLRTDSGELVRELLLDVRAAPEPDGSWRVTSTIDPPRPDIPPARAGGPTERGRAVLDNPRVRLSEPGRADIVDRRVGDPILAVLDDLARTRTLDVQVIVSGHPGTVFPTTRLSNHAVGRAVDIRAVDGRPVVAIPRDDPMIIEFMAAAGRAGATEVCGPVAPAGTGFRADEVHQDHFHLGITPTKPPAAASSVDTAAPRATR